MRKAPIPQCWYCVTFISLGYMFAVDTRENITASHGLTFTLAQSKCKAAMEQGSEYYFIINKDDAFKNRTMRVTVKKKERENIGHQHVFQEIG